MTKRQAAQVENETKNTGEATEAEKKSCRQPEESSANGERKTPGGEAARKQARHDNGSEGKTAGSGPETAGKKEFGSG